MYCRKPTSLHLGRASMDVDDYLCMACYWNGNMNKDTTWKKKSEHFNLS